MCPIKGELVRSVRFGDIDFGDFSFFSLSLSPFSFSIKRNFDGGNGEDVCCNKNWLSNIIIYYNIIKINNNWAISVIISFWNLTINAAVGIYCVNK